jgi:hypothetical protein
MLPVERRQASAPQGCSPTELTAMKKMEMQKIISYATVMKIQRNFFVGNICFVFYCLFVVKSRSEQACPCV